MRSNCALYIERYCAPEMQDDLRTLMQRRGNTVTIVESRPVVPGDTSRWFDVPVARMKYDAQSAGWTLYWFDRNSKAHRYQFLDPDQPIGALLGEVENDPLAIFWG